MSSQDKTRIMPLPSKNNLRARMRQTRQLVSALQRQSQSDIIVRQLSLHLQTLSAQTIGLYLATSYEVDLDPLIDLLHQQERKVYLPHLADRQHPFHQFESWESLEVGALNLRQPSLHTPFIDARFLDVVIVPGLAFDGAGNRLGHGGGWYDKVLGAAKPGPVIIGVCFECQLVETVPFEPFDVKMDVVMTSQG